MNCDVRNFKPVKPSEFKRIMKREGLTLSELGRMFDLHERTIWKYANGHVNIPFTVQFCMRSL